MRPPAQSNSRLNFAKGSYSCGNIFQSALELAVTMMALVVAAKEPLHAASGKASSWAHNGSTLYLMADGATREFYYNAPRAGMLQAGARPGSLLFTGRSVNGRYVGTAYIFNRQCGQLPYQVSGPILDNYERRFVSWL